MSDGTPGAADYGASTWQPSRAGIEDAQLTRFMRLHDLSSYRELHRRSVEEPDWFWGTIADDVGIRWMRPYDRVRDTSAGKPWTTWFTGAAVNIVDSAIDRHAEGGLADKPALVWYSEAGERRSFTYRELAHLVDRAAAGLRAVGLSKGDRVAIYSSVTPEAVIACYAAWKLGAIVVPLFAGFAGQALINRLEDADPAVVMYAGCANRRGSGDDLGERLDKVLGSADNPSLTALVRLNGPAGAVDTDRDLRQIEWGELVTLNQDPVPAEPLEPGAPAVIGYTSGTTGKPKGAVLTHIGFMCMGGREVKQQLDMRPDESLMWVTDWGWAVLPLWPMVGVTLLGGTAVLFEGAPTWPDANRLWKIVEAESVNVFGMAATAARILAREPDCAPRDHDLSSVRILGSTGEPWNQAPWDWYFQEVGDSRRPIINLCGGTEVTGCFLGTSVIEPVPPCSLGRPLPGMAAAAFDPDGSPVTPPGGGFLVCTEPWPGMTKGLWRAPERYIDAYWSRYDDIWFHGDWAEIDADGMWRVTGRVDDTIKVSGRRVGPAEIESALGAHAEVREAAVIGVPDEDTGEAILAVVVLDDPARFGDELIAELRAHVTATLGNGAAPKKFLAAPALPKTRSAKVVRSTIKAVILGTGEGTDRSVIENPEALDAIRDVAVAAKLRPKENDVRHDHAITR